MPLNNNGVGFSFAGKDLGVGKMMKRFQKVLLKTGGVAQTTFGAMKNESLVAGDKMVRMFKFTGNTLKWLWQSTSKFTGGMTASFVFVRGAMQDFFALFDPLKRMIAGVFDAIPSPADLAGTLGQIGEAGELTSSLEAEAVGLSKSAREMGAQMGFTGKALDEFDKKATSMAMSLNVGSDEAGKAIRAFKEMEAAQIDLSKALGVTSASDIVKFTSAMGINTDLLRNKTIQMRQEFGLTDEQINNVIGSTIKMGQETGDVPGAFETLSQQMERMREQAASMGTEIDGVRLVDFATQTSALGTALFQVSSDSDDAREGMADLANMLTTTNREFQNMFAGTQEDLPEFVKELAIATGNADSAFQLMQKGPLGMVEAMTQMVQAGVKGGDQMERPLQFLKARMEQALGSPEAAARLMDFFKTAPAAVFETAKATKVAEANLGAIGKEAFRTGRTTQEVFERMMESVGDSFRRLGKKDVREWAKNIQAGVKDAKANIRALAEDKGPLGEITRKLAEAQHIGLQAFVPKSLQAGSVVMGFFAKKLGPVVTMLKDAGINFTSFSGLLTTAAAGMALFGSEVLGSKKETESWGSALLRVANTVADDVVVSIKKWGSVLTQIVSEFGSFNWSDLFTGLGKTLSDEDAGPIGKILNAFRSMPWSQIEGNIRTGWNNLWAALEQSGVVDTVTSTFNTIVNDVIKPALMGMLNLVLETVPWGKIGEKVVGGILEGVGNIASAVSMELFTTEAQKSKLATMQANNKLMAERTAEQQAANVAAEAANQTRNAEIELMKKQNELMKAINIERDKGAIDAATASRNVGVISGLSVEEGTLTQANLTRAAKALESQGVVAMGMSKLVQGDADAMAAAVKAASDQMVADLSRPMETVQELHGSSMNTIIAHDLELAVGATEDATMRMADLFDELWINILYGVETAMPAIERAAGGLLIKLQSLTQAQEDLRAAKAEVSRAGTTDPERDFKIRQATGDQAVHNPAWYRGTDGYAQLFEKKMNVLIASVNAMGSKREPARPGELGAARQALEGRRRTPRAGERPPGVHAPQQGRR